MDLNFNNRLQRWSLPWMLGSMLLVMLGCNNSSLKDLALFRTSQPDDVHTFANSTRSFEADSLTLTVWHNSFDSAMEASAQSGKPILVDFTGSDWCDWCIRLQEDVFETREFKEWARDNVILLELDYPRRAIQPQAIKRQNAELKSRYNIRGFPTVLLLSADGEPIGKKMGYMDNPINFIEDAESHLGQVRTARVQEQFPTESRF